MRSTGGWMSWLGGVAVVTCVVACSTAPEAAKSAEIPAEAPEPVAVAEIGPGSEVLDTILPRALRSYMPFDGWRFDPQTRLLLAPPEALPGSGRVPSAHAKAISLFRELGAVTPSWLIPVDGVADGPPDGTVCVIEFPSRDAAAEDSLARLCATLPFAFGLEAADGRGLVLVDSPDVHDAVRLLRLRAPSGGVVVARPTTAEFPAQTTGSYVAAHDLDDELAHVAIVRAMERATIPVAFSAQDDLLWARVPVLDAARSRELLRETDGGCTPGSWGSGTRRLGNFLIRPEHQTAEDSPTAAADPADDEGREIVAVHLSSDRRMARSVATVLAVSRAQAHADGIVVQDQLSLVAFDVPSWHANRVREALRSALDLPDLAPGTVLQPGAACVVPESGPFSGRPRLELVAAQDGGAEGSATALRVMLGELGQPCFGAAVGGRTAVWAASIDAREVREAYRSLRAR